MERPNCKKCGEPALLLVSKMWLCGKCYQEMQERIDKIKQDFFIKENG